MKNFRGKWKIAALLGLAPLLVCLTLAACGDTPANNPPKAVPTNLPTLASFSTVGLSLVTTAGTNSIATPATTGAIPTTASPAATIAPTTPPVNSIKNNWLRGVPCKAPCWENITPGKTTPEEAQDLVKKNPAIGKIQVENPNLGNKPVAIYLYQANNATDLGFIGYHNEPKPAKVEIIKLEVDFYQPKYIFALYGEPSNVIVTEKTNELGRGTGEYKTYLVYLNQGLILSDISSKETALAPETVFNEVYFFIPGQVGFNILDAQDDMNGNLMVAWEGFKDAKYYCRYQVQTGIKTC